MMKKILDGKPEPFYVKYEDDFMMVYDLEEVEEWMDEFKDVIIMPTSEVEQAINRFRSVCNTGILSTCILGVCVGYLMKIDYIQFEIGIPVIFGLVAILAGFLKGVRSKN